MRGTSLPPVTQRQYVSNRQAEPLIPPARHGGRRREVLSLVGTVPPGKSQREKPEEKCQTACKPGSVRPFYRTGRPFLWDASHNAPHATNPSGGTGTSLRSPRNLRRDIAAAPIRSCSRWGLPCRRCCQKRGALLPHRFALARGASLLTPTSLARAVCFLWHCPWGRPRRSLTGTVFPWSPDFPPPTGHPVSSGRPAVWRRGCAPPRPNGQAPFPTSERLTPIRIDADVPPQTS
jgi:hypothetical protein